MINFIKNLKKKITTLLKLKKDYGNLEEMEISKFISAGIRKNRNYHIVIHFEKKTIDRDISSNIYDELYYELSKIINYDKKIEWEERTFFKDYSDDFNTYKNFEKGKIKKILWKINNKWIIEDYYEDIVSDVYGRYYEYRMLKKKQEND